jgi:hypothetical protein
MQKSTLQRESVSIVRNSSNLLKRFRGFVQENAEEEFSISGILLSTLRPKLKS